MSVRPVLLFFADGHVERRKWRHPKTFTRKQSYRKKAENAADVVDLRRLQSAILPVLDYKPQN